MSKKLFAEFFGTFWLVFGGCGSAIFAASVNLGIESHHGVLSLNLHQSVMADP